MCRLLGLIANKPVDLEFSLTRFSEFSKSNPDGWGVGWYEEDGSAKVFKQGIPADAPNSEFPILSKKVRSKIIIAHVRKGTRGQPADVNSHPFQFKNWIFAHNGSVDRDQLKSLLRHDYINELKGKTDSEVYFYLILQCIEEEDGNIINGIKKAINEVKSERHGGLNFLLSDGERLYAFRYSSDSRDYYSLWWLKREPSGSDPIEFTSEETKALLRSKSLKGEKAVLVCSEKLTEEEWKEIKFGSMLIIEPDLSVKEVIIPIKN